MRVTANGTNFGASGSQTVNLTDTEFNNTERDTATVTLNGGESNGSVQLNRSTTEGDAGPATSQ